MSETPSSMQHSVELPVKQNMTGSAPIRRQQGVSSPLEKIMAALAWKACNRFRLSALAMWRWLN